MSDATAEFFRDLVESGRQPLLSDVHGTVRFDLVDGSRTDHWLVALDKGDVTVSREEGSADCTVRTDKALFERLVRGEENAVASVLRGAIVCSGDVEVLMAFQRVFPGPPNQKGPTGRRNPQ
jgi:putative sterol carrier protein